MLPAVVFQSIPGDWRGVLDDVSRVPEEHRRSFSWIWPTETCLKCLCENFHAYGLKNFISIGCGSGLLEWLFQESCGVRVNGLELDKSWWTSRYAPATFIHLSYTGTTMSEAFLRKCAPGEPFVLFFCYFNNGKAFWEYLRNFHGQYIIIGGPKDGVGIQTDPSPYALLPENHPKVGSWTLKETIDAGDSLNIFTLYQRDLSSNFLSCSQKIS